MDTAEKTGEPRGGARPGVPSVTADERTLHVAWPDGHLSDYSLAELRRRCSCPLCRGLPRAVLLTRVCLVLTALTLVAGVLLVAVDAETVIVTAPALLLLSAVMAAAGWRSGYRRVGTLALCHAGIAAFLFALVVLNQWGPGQARAPFLAILTPYAIAMLAAKFRTFLHPPVLGPVLTWNCKTCGYLLYGLNEDRCPECGQAFDRAQFPPTPPAGALESATA